MSHKRSQDNLRKNALSAAPPHLVNGRDDCRMQTTWQETYPTGDSWRLRPVFFFNSRMKPGSDIEWLLVVGWGPHVSSCSSVSTASFRPGELNGDSAADQRHQQLLQQLAAAAATHDVDDAAFYQVKNLSCCMPAAADYSWCQGNSIMTIGSIGLSSLYYGCTALGSSCLECRAP